MSGFTRETDVHYLSRGEVDRILARARRMRAEVLRGAMSSGWATLQRSVTRKRAPRHA